MNGFEKLIQDMKSWDFNTLYKNKIVLMNNITNLVKAAAIPECEKENILAHIDGILSVIDAIGDAAEEEALFTYPELKNDSNNNSYENAEYNYVANKMTIEEFLNSDIVEETYAVQVKNGIWYPIMDIEYWESCPEHYEEPYRIEYFVEANARPYEWILDNKEIAEVGLAAALLNLRGRMAGGICFCGEEDRENYLDYKTLKLFVELLESEEGYDSLSILTLAGNEFLKLYEEGFEDGLYIFRFI